VRFAAAARWVTGSSTPGTKPASSTWALAPFRLLLALILMLGTIAVLAKERPNLIGALPPTKTEVVFGAVILRSEVLADASNPVGKQSAAVSGASFDSGLMHSTGRLAGRVGPTPRAPQARTARKGPAKAPPSAGTGWP